MMENNFLRVKTTLKSGIEILEEKDGLSEEDVREIAHLTGNKLFRFQEVGTEEIPTIIGYRGICGFGYVWDPENLGHEHCPDCASIGGPDPVRKDIPYPIYDWVEVE